MNICFFDHNPNMNVGSYRIWVHDLNETFNEIGHKSRICNNFDSLLEAKEDIIIFSKGSAQLAENYSADKLVGAINVPANKKIKNVDFVIAGSHEEKISLSHYDNVFIYPLIEKKFMNLPEKIHKNSGIFKIAFHGHYPHLFKFSPHLRDAINDLSRQTKVELHIVTGEDSDSIDKWWNHQIGRPDSRFVDTFFYNYDKISEVLFACDVGVVPNIADAHYTHGNLKELTSKDLGLYDTDYVIRMKNKTNPGRAFVLYQHGLPVIHDMSPSSFEMMSYTRIFDVAFNSKSWYNLLKKYAHNERERQFTADIFRKTFEEIYNPHMCAMELTREIMKLREI